MAQHARFTAATGMKVYFCDPKSPWQRGSIENTNGLLRQYLPRTRDFRILTQADLDAIAAELNGSPRQTLGLKTPRSGCACDLASRRGLCEATSPRSLLSLDAGSGRPQNAPLRTAATHVGHAGRCHGRRGPGFSAVPGASSPSASRIGSGQLLTSTPTEVVYCPGDGKPAS